MHVFSYMHNYFGARELMRVTMNENGKIALYSVRRHGA